jgi:pilus assembly protein Flp/PilA
MRLRAWLKDESGATAIEYGLIAAAMALMLIPALNSLTTHTGGLFGSIAAIFDHPMFDDGYF